MTVPAHTALLTYSLYSVQHTKHYSPAPVHNGSAINRCHARTK